MTIGDRIRERRTALGLTQEALAHKAGISVPTVSRVERGLHKPNLGNLALIAGALGCLMADLVPEPEPAA